MAKFNTDAFALALSGRRAISKYPFPGVDGQRVGVRMLRDEEVDEARVEAQHFLKEKGVIVEIDPEFFDREIQRRLVARAFVDAESDADFAAPFFESVADVRSLDSVMVRHLYELYVAHVHAMDPLLGASVEEVDEIVEALGKSASAERLTQLDRLSLLNCVLSMASRLRAMRPTSK